MIWIRYKSTLLRDSDVTQQYNTVEEAKAFLLPLGVIDFDTLCGFPVNDFHTSAVLEPCKQRAIDTAEFQTPDGLLIVPICESCYYRVLRLYPRDIVELVKNNQLAGEWRR